MTGNPNRCVGMVKQLIKPLGSIRASTHACCAQSGMHVVKEYFFFVRFCSTFFDLTISCKIQLFTKYTIEKDFEKKKRPFLLSPSDHDPL